MSYKRLDLTGQEFNYWKVIEYSHDHKKQIFWKCQCICGINLTKEQFNKLINQNCYWDNKKPSQIYRRPREDQIVYYYNGIDRLDSSKGYTIDNCVPCCKNCNTAKLRMSKIEFLEWIKNIYH